MPRFAANLSLLFPETAFMDRFSRAAHDGFEAVEFLFPYDYPAAEIAGRLAENGLTQVLFNAPPGDWKRGDRGLACFPARRNEFRESIEIALDYADTLRCTRIHVMAGLRTEGNHTEALLETYVENLREAADRAARQGVTLLIEPLNPYDMPGYFLSSLPQAVDVIDRVGRPNLRLQADVYHLQRMQGELASTLAARLDIIGHIQIADTPGRHEPGTGEINYPFLFTLLDRLNYQGWVGCEYVPSTGMGSASGWMAVCKIAKDTQLG